MESIDVFVNTMEVVEVVFIKETIKLVILRLAVVLLELEDVVVFA